MSDEYDYSYDDGWSSGYSSGVDTGKEYLASDIRDIISGTEKSDEDKLAEIANLIAWY